MLLPPDLRDWLPKDHRAYFILDIDGKLDLSSIHASYDGSKKGGHPWFLLFPPICIRLVLRKYQLVGV